MQNSKLKRITVALCMALIPISVFAAGLGKLNVMSGLGEPLKADIELIAVTPEDLSSITATIASQEDYAAQGIEKPASHNTIKVEVAKNANGTPILKLKSAQPISEPFLDMLIRVDWASGRLLREYTVLLDPPGYTGEPDASAQTAQAPIIASKTSPQQRGQQSPIMASQDNVMQNETSKPVAKKYGKHNKKAKQTEMPAADVNADTAGQDYTTQRGDTLAKIAREMKPEGISLEQMLVGLYEANPQAFDGKNMNRLKVGQIVRQPSPETLNAISSGQAVKEIKVQAANWNAYRNKLAGIVATAAPDDAEASAQSAGGKIKTAAEDKSIPAASGPKDVVKLSAGDASATKTDLSNIKAMQDKITALQEEATAREKSVKEAQSRTADLEKQIADMQKLLAMKNGAMADLEKQAQTQAATKTAEAATPVPVVAPTPVAEAPAETAASTKPIESEVAKAPAPTVKPASVPNPPEEPSFISSMTDGLDLGVLAPLGGALALLGGGWFYLRKKREKSLADFEQGIMTSGGLKANTVFGNTANSNVETGDTSFLTDFSQSANGGMIDTNDVDPIAEAEVYMAYGRDAQAEEILKDAIAKEPKRHELHLKLLEMYAASKNLSAFETIAGELYTSLGAEDPTWAKVAEIGVKLEPNNPLYQSNSQPTGIAGKLDANDFSNSPLAAEKDLDFSFDNQSLVQDFANDAPNEMERAPKELTADNADLTFDADKTNASSGNAGHTKAAVVAAAGLAVQSFADDPLAGSDKADNMLSFDMPNLGVPTIDMANLEPPLDLPTVSPVLESETNSAMPSLDIPTFDAPQFMSEEFSAAALKSDVAEDFNVDFAEFESSFPSTITPKKADGDAPLIDTSFAETQAVSDVDFNFDMTVPAEESVAATAFKNTDFSDANAFDLTAISLDLEDSATKAPSQLADFEMTSSDDTTRFTDVSAEPIAVDTKLDLVAAYIEMDDKIGAKELLDEVMKEGGAKQRMRAEQLLAKLS